MKRQLLIFLTAFIAILAIELFQYDIYPYPADSSGNGVGAFAVPNNNDIQADNAGSGSSLLAGGNERTDSSMPKPVTLILIGSGLIGLAGLGRKKTHQ